MTITIIKPFLLFAITFFLFNKITNTELNIISRMIKYPFFSILLAVITLFCKQRFSALSYIIPFIVFWLILCFMTSFKAQILFIYALICYCTVLILYSVSAAIWGILTFHFLNSLSPTLIYFFSLLSIFTTFILLLLILKLKKFHTAINYLIHNSLFNYGLILYFLCILFLTIEQVYSHKIILMSFARMIAIITLLFISNFWWRNQVTRAYREKLRLLEIKNLRSEKEQNEAYITKLECENKRLGAIIHKDNRIVSAMADSVCDYLNSSAFNDPKTLQLKGASLADEINSIRETRQNLLQQDSSIVSFTQLTGITGIDAIILFMKKEASSYDITLKFHYDINFFKSKQLKSNEMDLVHLLSDLLENAIIATKNAHGKSIELSFQILKGTPAISVSDNGIPFEIDTYMKFGISETTTHANEGGTGIGLMDIWTFKKNEHASLVIEELNNAIYSKRISLLFDNKDKYLVVSSRFQQISSIQSRSDLLIINTVLSDINGITELPHE